MSQNDDNDVPQGATPVAGSDASAGASEDSSPAASGGADEAFPPEPFERHAESDTIVDNIVGVLRTIYDPEIPVNIYEIGLIYEIVVDTNAKAFVKMTLTSPACPVAGSLPPEVEQKVAGALGVRDCEVRLVWDPPWGPERMSEAARLQLNL